MSSDCLYNAEQIRQILPHEYPFLLVDRIISVEPGTKADSRVGRTAKGIKNVTINEQFFNGHFPIQKVMPGVLIIEAMAQVGGISCYDESVTGDQSLIIASVRGAKFRKPVVPGDQLILTGTVVRDRKTTVVIDCKGHVDGNLVAEAEIVGHLSLVQSNGRVF